MSGTDDQPPFAFDHVAAVEWYAAEVEVGLLLNREGWPIGFVRENTTEAGDLEYEVCSLRQECEARIVRTDNPETIRVLTANRAETLVVIGPIAPGAGDRSQSRPVRVDGETIGSLNPSMTDLRSRGGASIAKLSRRVRAFPKYSYEIRALEPLLDTLTLVAIAAALTRRLRAASRSR